MTTATTPFDESMLDVAVPRRRGRAVVLWMMVALVSFSSVWAGVEWRSWWFRVTAAVHHEGDITRNWMWGSYTFHNIHDKGRSFLDTYDDVGVQDRNVNEWLDYAPARLLVYTGWAAWNHRARPYQWYKPYSDFRDLAARESFQSFFLNFNTVMEALAAIAAFMLTRNVVRRSGQSEPRAVVLAMIAALLMWFNPAMILSAHGWPNGDMWVVPGFLWAVYLARINRWGGAGAVLALGTLFKGQLFFVMPVFFLWPIFQFRFFPVLRLAGGFIGVFGLLTSGWTLGNVDPNHLRHLNLPALSVTVLPWLLLAIFLILRRKIPRLQLAHARLRPILLACFGISGAMAFLSMWMFDTSYAWFDSAYRFGAEYRRFMNMGVTSNLPSIMAMRYGWHQQNGLTSVVFYLDQAHQYPVVLRQFMFALFMGLTVLSTIGIAMHDRRNSALFLIAIVTPWLLFFTIPCQIHSRYLLFAACAASVCVGYSWGMTLLGLFCTALTWLMTMQAMAGGNRLHQWNILLHQLHPTWFAEAGRNGFAQSLRRFIMGTYPDIGWAVMLTTLIFLYFTLTPLWTRRRDKKPAIALPPVASPAIGG